MALVSSRGEKKAMAYEFEFDLPEEIIQRIQYFLGGTIEFWYSREDINKEDVSRIKEAARTCVLSKSWSSAWSTRPVLILSNNFFRFRCWGWHQTVKDYANFVRETIQRYKNLNISMHCLVLVIIDYMAEKRYLLDELIADSLNLGLNELHVRVCRSYGSDSYRLPAQVLETTTLTKLRVHNCSINTAGRVLCSRLASLTLYRCGVDEGGIHLSQLCNNLVDLSLHLPSPNNPIVKFMDPGSGIGGLQYRNLKSMYLSCEKIDEFFFTQFSSLFPRLENFTLDSQVDYTGYEYIHISSQSLKYLKLVQGWDLKEVKLEVPDIRKLIFMFDSIPSLSLVTKSKNWQSHVQVRRVVDVGVSELRKFLTELSGSKITLYFRNIIFLEGAAVSSLATPPPVVENLIWSSNQDSGSLFECLFECCRPRFITFDWWCSWNGSMLSKFISDASVLHNKERYNINQKCAPMELINPVQRLFLTYGLEEVIVELFDRYLQEWRIILSGNLSDPSSIMDVNGQEIRIHFVWGGV